MSPHTAPRWPRLTAWGDAVRAAARGVGLWWGYPWCPVDPDECGRVHDVEQHLSRDHRQAAA